MKHRFVTSINSIYHLGTIRSEKPVHIHVLPGGQKKTVTQETRSKSAKTKDILLKTGDSIAEQCQIVYNFQFDILFQTIKITVFLRALFFHNVRTTRHKYLRINGRNGSYNKPFKLKMIHVHLSLFYYAWQKFQMIPSFSN